MIKRLIPAYTQEELAKIYAYSHDHTQWPDHVLRVQETMNLANEFLTEDDEYAADLSCGDGYILTNLPHVKYRIYGDFNRKDGADYVGPIERTIEHIPMVNVFVLCETLEHLDDPAYVLAKIREKTVKLILSTPEGAFGDDNPEHYWAWDRAGVGELLRNAGFNPKIYRETRPPIGYRFQIWGCN